MKNCLVCNIEISDNKKYCSRGCYNIVLKKNLKLRNKSNIGKSWVEIMERETTEIRKKKQNERKRLKSQEEKKQKKKKKTKAKS